MLRQLWEHDLAWSFRRSPVTVAAALLAAVCIGGALLAPWLAPQNPFDLAALDLNEAFKPPLWSEGGVAHYPFGTDNQGRDVLSTILYGTRLSLGVGFASVLFAMVLGVSLGLAAGYFGGRLDAVIMRIADVQLSFPAILIALILIAVLGQGTSKVIIALVTVQWAYYARTVRSAALVEKRKEYVEAARCLATLERDLAQRLRFDAVFWAMRPGGPRWSEMLGRVRGLTPGFVLVAEAYEAGLALSIEESGGFLLGRPIAETELDRVLCAIESRLPAVLGANPARM
jgi:ABC-type antimicrobial peptide transport system permease subunit